MKKAIAIPHDKPFENFATICKPSALIINVQMEKISIEFKNPPKNPVAPIIEFILVNNVSGSVVPTNINERPLIMILIALIIPIYVVIENSCLKVTVDWVSFAAAK